MGRIGVAACVYHIWRERNRRLFQNSKSNVDTVIQRINKEIKWKLMGLLVKTTIAVLSKGNLQNTTMVEPLNLGDFLVRCPSYPLVRLSYALVGSEFLFRETEVFLAQENGAIRKSALWRGWLGLQRSDWSCLVNERKERYDIVRGDESSMEGYVAKEKSEYGEEDCVRVIGGKNGRGFE
ncbi:hypothetical protein Tco_1045397 [Tanacetum coccineum]|uniref:Uncharacterized protein n=1 Tax=Tanacetum coccineum TaxID=301880 RepID=A0ABQ5GUJ9_9ASTR